MSDDEPMRLDRAGLLLTQLPADELSRICALSAVRAAVDQALDEAMAHAAVAGHSLRAIAEQAGLTPNAVAPRLARTRLLGSYAADRRVSASGIERARYDTEQGRPAPAAPPAQPMRFRRRRSTGGQ